MTIGNCKRDAVEKTTSDPELIGETVVERVRNDTATNEANQATHQWAHYIKK